MIRAVFAAAAIVSVVTAAGAQAQTQTAPPEPTLWQHNDSVMYLVESGASREFHYQKPRPGMLEAGARPGSLLFRGRVDNGQYSGTAYIFNPRCGPVPFQVRGSALDNDERIVLTGEAPLVGRRCRIYKTYASTLEFKRLPPSEAAQSPQPSQAAGAADSEGTQPEAPRPANRTPPPAKDSTGSVAAEHAMPGTPTPAPSAIDKDPNNYRSGAVLIVMIVSLFGFSLVISLDKNVFRKR